MVLPAATGTLVVLTMTGCSAGSAALLTQPIRKVAGVPLVMTLPVLASTFSTRWSPPTTKQEAPALRTPAGLFDGDGVVLATLQNCWPGCGFRAVRSTVKSMMNAEPLLTLENVASATSVM